MSIMLLLQTRLSSPTPFAQPPQSLVWHGQDFAGPGHCRRRPGNTRTPGPQDVVSCLFLVVLAQRGGGRTLLVLPGQLAPKGVGVPRPIRGQIPKKTQKVLDSLPEATAWDVMLSKGGVDKKKEGMYEAWGRPTTTGKGTWASNVEG